MQAELGDFGAVTPGAPDVEVQHYPPKNEVPDNAASQPSLRRESVRVSSSLQ
jgi:hypothetical protein